MSNEIFHYSFYVEIFPFYKVFFITFMNNGSWPNFATKKITIYKLAIEREKYYTPLLIKTNEDIDYLKSYFDPKEKNFALKNVNEILVEEKILKLVRRTVKGV